MKRYKLLKDLPTFNAGDEFALRDDGCLYLVDTAEGAHRNAHWAKEVMAYHRKTLERFPTIIEDWFEEVEVPDYYLYLDSLGGVCVDQYDADYVDKRREEIGNSFKSEEKAEKVAKKLKAWKRLKDKGFRFDGWNIPVDGKGITIFANYPSGTRADLDLLFSQEDS